MSETQGTMTAGTDDTALLHNVIERLERENRRLLDERNRAERTVAHLRGTIDKLEKTIINQALLLDRILTEEERTNVEKAIINQALLLDRILPREDANETE